MARFFCREIDNDDSDGEFIEAASASEAAAKYAEHCDLQSGEWSLRRVSVCDDAERVFRFVAGPIYTATLEVP